MRLLSIAAAARGHNTTIAFKAPITVIAGPTGAGKTTVLNCLQVGLTGAVTADGKMRSKPGDVFDLLSAGGEPVDVELTFDAGAPKIRRVIAIDSKGACGQTLMTDGIKASKISDVEKMITERVGDLTRVDVVGLLGREPAKRRAEILQACRASAKPVAMAEIAAEFERVVQAAKKTAADALAKLEADEKASPEKIDEAREIAEATVPMFDFAVDPTKGLIASAEAKRDAAKEAVAAAILQIKQSQQAIDSYVAQASEQGEAGDMEALKARVAELDAEISKVAEEIGGARGAQATRDGIQRRLNELVEAGTVEDAQAALTVARAGQASADVELKAAPLAVVGEWSPAPQIRVLEQQAAEQSRAHDAAKAKASELVGVLARLRASLARIAEGGCCPTCARAMDETARTAVEVEIAKTEAEHAAADALAVEEGDTLDCILADLTVAKDEDAAARSRCYEGVQADFRAHHEAKTRASAAKQQTEAAQARLARAEAAVKEREALRVKADAIPVADVTLLETQRRAAEEQRTAVKARLDAVAADEARQQMYRQTVVKRDDLKATIPTLKLAARAFAGVADYVGQRATEPMVGAVNESLPPGWALELNIADASLAIRRGESLTPWAGLSGGERGVCLAAVAVGMANVSGNPWRAVLVDGGEAIAGADWEDEALPEGLFGAFVRSLAGAIEAKKLDQAIITTNRAPLDAERYAIELAGASIHWMGRVKNPAMSAALARFSEPDDEPEFLGEPAFMGPPDYLDEPRQPSLLDLEPPVSRGGGEPRDMDAERGAVRLRMNQAGISAEAMEYLMVQFTDRKDRPVSSATLKRVVLDGALAQLDKGRTAAQVIRQINLAVETHPIAKNPKNPAPPSAAKSGAADDVG